MHDFTILILEGSYASSVAVTRDILAAARALAVRAGMAAPRWRLCSLEGGAVRLQGGMTIETVKLPRRTREDRSIWVLPGLGLNTPADVAQRLATADAAKAMTALARHADNGGHVAASCSAVFLLQSAGLLKGRRATTTWWLAALLQDMAPDCRVDADRMICADGPVITAGAALAQTDLMLYLLRERFGKTLTDTVSRMMIIDGRQAQAPFIIPEAMAGGSDLVARIAARIEAALPHPPTIAELAQEFCMSERTLSRHIRKATGKSTLALLQSVRLRRARNLLESSRLTVEQIAEAVGYRDATALRRLMRKMAGASPSRYRPDSATSPPP
jgi:transcriptional regulator GlxA family with amidase domain